MAQMDIEIYDDSIDVHRTARWVLRKGCPAPLVACVHRMHFMPCVERGLPRGQTRACVGRRATGTLTGSRVVAALGRVDAEDMLREQHCTWQCWGVAVMPPTTLIAMFHVDKLFAVGSWVCAILSLMADPEAYLLSKWGLRVKPGSREVLVLNGSPEHADGPT